MENQATREVFQNFPLWMQLTFYVAAFSAIGLFLYGTAWRLKKYRRGRAAGRPDGLGARLWRALMDAAGLATRVGRRDPYVGFAHNAIFWGFVVLFIGTAILTLDHDIARLVGKSFFHGAFYLGYSLAMDAYGVFFLVGLIMMAVRRGLMKPFRLRYDRADGKEDPARKAWVKADWAFLIVLFFIGFSGFRIEALRITMDRPEIEAIFSPVGWMYANLVAAMGVSPQDAEGLHTLSWWFHALFALGFIAYLPYSKALHIPTAYASLAVRDDLAARRLPAMPETDGYMGYKQLSDFTWKELLHFDACTKCGRCHEVCPARTCGAPLSPRDVILDLRAYSDQAVGGKAPEADVAGGVIAADTLWACTTCRACVEICPVAIEHVPVFVQMRRHLVDTGEMDENLQDTLMKLSRQGNSFGQSERMRGKWVQGLDFPVKDARKEPVHYLWFVGDYASYDPRVQDVTRSVARVFRRAGLDYGIMFEGERNAGNDVRRVGEEGLYEVLVEHNLKSLAKAQFEEIVTTDPHSLNTLKNEYPDFGGDFRVSHYTEVLARLLDAGKLPIQGNLKVKATYHDPCYLGRYNGVFAAPRRLIEATGVQLVEMPRNRDNSFCCGAGGGRIWMGDALYKEKPAENRIREAAALGVELFIVACPKDLAMYQDAVKTAGFEGRMQVKDIIQLLEADLAAEEEGLVSGGSE